MSTLDIRHARLGEALPLLLIAPAGVSAPPRRFRHPHGDVGPLRFGSSTTVQVLKDRLVQSWPPGASPTQAACCCPGRPCLGANGTLHEQRGAVLLPWQGLAVAGYASHQRTRAAEGPMSTEVPQTFADLRLILNGKFLDNTETLNSASAGGLPPAQPATWLLHSAQRRARCRLAAHDGRDRAGHRGHPARRRAAVCAAEGHQ